MMHEENHQKKQLALEEYIVGGSHVASLIEGFEKILELKLQALGMTETSPKFSFKITAKHTIYQNEN
jgi:hypothetical protein